MKVQLRRIKTMPIHNETPLDDQFIKGSVKRLPVVGETLTFYHRHFGEGWWITTPIREIVKRGKQIDYITMNSIYTLVKGWGDPK